MKIKIVKYHIPLPCAVMVFFFSIVTLEAQIIQPGRFEMAIPEQQNIQVISAGVAGLFLLNPSIGVSNREELWQVIKLDTAFAVQWNKNIKMNVEQAQLDQYFSGHWLHLLFSNPSVRHGDLELISLNERGTVERQIIKNFIPLTFHDFKVIDNIVLISGYFNYRPLVILYNLEERIPRVLPGFFNDRSELIEIKINNNGTFDVLLAGKDYEKNNTIFINTYNVQGGLVKKIILDAEKSKGLLFGRAQSLGLHGQLIAGVYGRRNSEYSRGLFIANVNAYGEQKITFYNYAELDNFFNYMRARKESRVRRRIERKRVKNKKIRFNYRLLVHKLVKKGDQYILMGEAFYPKYRSVTNGGGIFSPRWRGNWGGYQSEMVFDGYHYTHAVILAFDAMGNLLWDNSFEIKDVVSYELEQFVHVSSSKSDSTMALLYVYDNAIRSKIIKGSEVIEGKGEMKIKLPYKDDTVGDHGTMIGGLEKWYGDVFFTYGEQTVRNFQSDQVAPLRKVFFVNKVMYE